MEARGFTLLELIVVLAIAAILARVAILNIHAWLPDFRLRGAVRQIVVDLRRTRARAVDEHTSRRLVFDSAVDSYQAQRRSNHRYEDDGAAVLLPATVDLLDCTALGDAITFSSRGTASTFGTVVLRAENGREQRIVVDIAGRIRVQ